MNFENRLKNYRKNLGLKKRELADKLELSESYYNMIENGKRNPSKSFIIKLVNYSKKSEEYWIYGILKDSIYMKKLEYCLENKDNNLLCKYILHMLDDIKLD
ncbi:helix-turn-helix domain-containing protein [Clostridium butyricum]|uniref:helix-turn-helix domain-containing protein n=1 Tax=Clostridium butyricum TaxID=1492 RepID=UPI0022DFB832|nr:helix-turn-helix transcriptional regulator [Clostridium butyricum]